MDDQSLLDTYKAIDYTLGPLLTQWKKYSMTPGASLPTETAEVKLEASKHACKADLYLELCFKEL